MENQPKQILIYKTSEGKVPFEEWLNKLKDGKTRAKIKTRLTRGSILIILLCGGDKDSQQKDIRQAKQYWLDYQSNQGNDKD